MPLDLPRFSLHGLAKRGLISTCDCARSAYFGSEAGRGGHPKMAVKRSDLQQGCHPAAAPCVPYPGSAGPTAGRGRRAVCGPECRGGSSDGELGGKSLPSHIFSVHVRSTPYYVPRQRAPEVAWDGKLMPMVDIQHQALRTE